MQLGSTSTSSDGQPALDASTSGLDAPTPALDASTPMLGVSTPVLGAAVPTLGATAGTLVGPGSGAAVLAVEVLGRVLGAVEGAVLGLDPVVAVLLGGFGLLATGAGIGSVRRYLRVRAPPTPIAAAALAPGLLG